MLQASISVDLSRHKIALAHHWFFSMSGGERVCEAIFQNPGQPGRVLHRRRSGGAAALHAKLLVHHEFHTRTFPAFGDGIGIGLR